MLHYLETEDIIEEIEHFEQSALLAGNHARVAQDISSIKIYGNINHKGDALHSRLLLSFKMAQEIDGCNHKEIDRRVAKKAKSLSETPLTVVAQVGKHARYKIEREKQHQPEHVVFNGEKQPCDIGKQRCYNQFQGIHTLLLHGFYKNQLARRREFYILPAQCTLNRYLVL